MDFRTIDDIFEIPFTEDIVMTDSSNYCRFNKNLLNVTPGPYGQLDIPVNKRIIIFFNNFEIFSAIGNQTNTCSYVRRRSRPPLPLPLPSKSLQKHRRSHR